MGALNDYAMPDSIQNSLAPSISLQEPLLRNLIEAAYRYINPKVTYSLKVYEDIPLIAESYGLDTTDDTTQYGIITSTNYDSKYTDNGRETNINVEFNQLLSLPNVEYIRLPLFLRHNNYTLSAETSPI
jgi:hypothetical protein